MKRFCAVLLVFLLAGCSVRAADPSSAPALPEPSSLPSSAASGPPSSAPESEPPADPTPISQPEQPAPAVPDPLDEVPDEETPEQPPSPPQEQQAQPENSPAGSPAPSAPAGNGGESRTFWEIREDMVENVTAFREQNPDTVGWLYIYETTVDSPVFQREDNTYYLKHNDYQQEDVNGAIVSDFRNRLTGRDRQSQNLVLYAHSKDENPDGGVEASREFEHFTELKRYQNRDFCMAHPYFLFATGEESMVFEIFAAFHTKTSFVYNTPDPSRSQMEAILAEAKKKSLFDFGVEVTADDRIMTLSTCCRRIVPTYPNGYRFVIMGRLVEKGRVLNYDRTVTENPTALTPWNNYEGENDG